jgi:6-phosphogluconolactonase (cycloisomerase 2 family)
VVNCTVISTYTVSGTITGLAGTGLELQTHGTNIPITGSTFSVSLASGTAYQVQVTTQPTNATQNCVVTNGGPGTVTNANISNVMVACTTTSFTVTVNATFVSGANTGLTLFDNGADSLSVTGTGQFTFATPVASGTTYVVTVATQPTSTPAQYCIVTGGTGTVTTAAITNVNVSCRNVGQALFVANTYDGANGSVSGFMIDSTSGNLAGALGSPYAAHMKPSAIALDVRGQYAYVANLNSADVTTFSVSPTTGILSPIGNTLTSGVLTFSVAVDPMGGYVFAGSDSGGAEGLVDTFSIIAPTSPGLSLVPSPLTVGNDPLALAVDPTGSFVFAPERYDDTVWVLNIGTGGVLSNGNNSPFTNGTGSGPAGVAVYPTGGYIYVANAGNFRSVPSEPLTSYSGTVSAYAYDGTTGALTPLTSLGSPYAVGSGTGSGATGITIDPTGRFLYVTAFNDGTVSAFSIAPLTGALSAVGSPVVTGSQPTDVKVDPSGHFAYVANSGTGTVSEYKIDPNTGALSAVLSGGTIPSAGAAAIAIE